MGPVAKCVSFDEIVPGKEQLHVASDTVVIHVLIHHGAVVDDGPFRLTDEAAVGEPGVGDRCPQPVVANDVRSENRTALGCKVGVIHCSGPAEVHYASACVSADRHAGQVHRRGVPTEAVSVVSGDGSTHPVEGGV